jgi:F-type H+-transporting ATPase subunit c
MENVPSPRLLAVEEEERKGRSTAREGEEMTRIGKLVPVLCGVLLMASPALAQTSGAGDVGTWKGLVALAAGLGLGIAAFGAAMAQGRATAAAMESIGRNPNSADRIFTPLIVGLALMEAIALYALVIAFQLANKI